jgi:hypothetical protein
LVNPEKVPGSPMSTVIGAPPAASEKLNLLASCAGEPFGWKRTLAGAEELRVLVAHLDEPVRGVGAVARELERERARVAVGVDHGHVGEVRARRCRARGCR